jgi:plastocyanin
MTAIRHWPHGAIPFIVLLISGVAAAAYAAEANVEMAKTAFNPAEITIHQGQSVAFINADTMAHQVVGNGADLFDLKLQQPGATTEHRFMNAGSFSVRCDLHPRMKLVVHVQ